MSSIKVNDISIDVEIEESDKVECFWEPAPDYSFEAEVDIDGVTGKFPYFANKWPEPQDVLYAIAVDAMSAAQATDFEDFCQMNGYEFWNEADEENAESKALEIYEQCQKAQKYFDKVDVYYGDILDAIDNEEFELLEESNNSHSLLNLFNEVLENK